MSIRSLFTDTDLDRIRAVTSEGETKHAGEIVPYLVGSLDDYDVARWRAAMLCAVAAVLLAGAIHTYAGVWWGNGIYWLTLPAVCGAGFGYFLSWLPAIRRLLLTDGDIDPMMQWRAESAFLEEEVFRTRDRTGILVFLAVFERRAVVLADEGITKAVPADLWTSVIEELVMGIRAGRAADALCSAIERCGEILQEFGVEKRVDDRDELVNGLRIRER